MTRKGLKSVLIMVLLMVYSCDEPQTVVTNTVHPNGSVTRKIEMRNNENKFELSNLQVPFDSTWIIKDTIEIDEKGDTTWIKTAEKLFKNVDEINKCYLEDKGANRNITRNTEFVKRFKWFNTEYKFSEKIDRKMLYGNPIKESLSQEELLVFYTPESIISEKLSGPDSLKYKALNDTIRKKVDKWTTKSMVLEWIVEFSNLTEGKAGKDISKESLNARVDELVKVVEAYPEKFDSLWAKGIILKDLIGENNSIRYRTEADTAIAIVTRRLFINFKDYSVRIVMPGKVIGTNGFIDKSEILLWPVKSDFFLTEPYEMWAESKTSNTWAWIVSGVFLLFVMAGMVFRLLKK